MEPVSYENKIGNSSEHLIENTTTFERRWILLSPHLNNLVSYGELFDG